MGQFVPDTVAHELQENQSGDSRQDLEIPPTGDYPSPSRYSPTG